MLDHGKTTVNEICKLYDVSSTSVYRWQKKYSKLPPNEQVIVEKDSEYKKVLLLSKEIANMKRLIGEQQIKLDYYTGILKQANVHYEEDIEKKFG